MTTVGLIGRRDPPGAYKPEEPMTSPAHQAAEHYVAKVNAGDLEGLVALFAPDATLLHPAGRFQGHDAIRGFYSDNVLLHSPRITASSWVDADRSCVFEMDARPLHGDAVSHAIDHMTVDGDGRIERLAVYYR
jgi:steroid Delta-isomerase